MLYFIFQVAIMPFYFITGATHIDVVYAKDVACMYHQLSKHYGDMSACVYWKYSGSDMSLDFKSVKSLYTFVQEQPPEKECK